MNQSELKKGVIGQCGNGATFQNKAEACCDFARPKFMLRPCSTHVSTLFDSWFDPVRLMIRPCSTHDSTLFDSWFDPVGLPISPRTWTNSPHLTTWTNWSTLHMKQCPQFDHLNHLKLLNDFLNYFFWKAISCRTVHLQLKQSSLKISDWF